MSAKHKDSGDENPDIKKAEEKQDTLNTETKEKIEELKLLSSSLKEEKEKDSFSSKASKAFISNFSKKSLNQTGSFIIFWSILK